jgi:hypothetical protein
MRINWLGILSYSMLVVLILPVLLLLYWGLGPFYDSIGISLQMQKAIILSLISSAIAVFFIALPFYTSLILSIKK